MANYKIANEQEAATIGGGTSYTSNLAVTKIRAINLGCTIRNDDEYSNDRLIPLYQLQKISYIECNCNSTQCDCNGYISGTTGCYNNIACSCNWGHCYDCNSKSSCGCNYAVCGCYQQFACSCDNICSSHNDCSGQTYCQCNGEVTGCGIDCYEEGSVYNCDCDTNTYCTGDLYGCLCYEACGSESAACSYYGGTGCNPDTGCSKDEGYCTCDGPYCACDGPNCLCDGSNCTCDIERKTCSCNTKIIGCPGECTTVNTSCGCNNSVCDCDGYNAGCSGDYCNPHNSCSNDYKCDDCYADYGGCNPEKTCTCHGEVQGCNKECKPHDSCKCNGQCTNDCPTNYD